MHSDDTGAVGRALAAALAKLGHHLYYNKSWFVGSDRRGYTRDRYDASLQRFAAAEWWDGESDCITDFLAEVISLQAEGARRMPDGGMLRCWEQTEAAVNARIRIVLSLLGSGLTSRLLTECVPSWEPLPPLALTYIPDYLPLATHNGDIGQPDFLLVGDDVLVSIELKVRGGSAKAQYVAYQHFKYLRLASEAKSKHGEHLLALHLLLAPLQTRGLIAKPRDWLIAYPSDGELLVVDTDGCLATFTPPQRQHVNCGGGMTWLNDLAAEMTTVALDLGRFLESAGRQPVDNYAVRHELHRQVSRAIEFSGARLSGA